MAGTAQYLKLGLQHKAAHGVHLQVQVTALVTGAAPVHVHLAAGLHPVVHLVVVNPVGANQGVTSAHLHRARQLHTQVGAAFNAVTLHIGGQFVAVIGAEGFGQAAAGLELELGREVGACRQHGLGAGRVLQALQLLGALQLRP